MDLGLANKTVLVTGASGGIGQSIALQFADEGANVGVHFRTNQENARAVENKIGANRSLAVQADLTDENQVKGAFEQVTQRFGAPQILIANAGVWPSDHRPIHQMPADQWRQTLNTNLTSVFLCCREFLKGVAASTIENPAIVLIGSTAAVFGEAGHGDYAASKSGLTYGLMLTLKNEIAQISRLGRINTVCPGWTVTPMAQKFVADGKAIERALSTIAMRKVAGPNDIANAVLFLASSRVAGHISGQVLTVSGGMEGRKLYDEAGLDAQAAMPF